jgi:hypothetical protein
LLLSVLWTSFRTKEYPPEEYRKYNGIEDATQKKMSFADLLKNIPPTMWQLAVTQFFSWFSLFLMWVYTTQGIAQHIWGTTDATSKDFNEAGNWTGVIFAAYSIFAALYSLVLTRLANSFGRKNTYMISLILGGLGLLSMVFIHDKYLLFASMIGVGIAWAAILRNIECHAAPQPNGCVHGHIQRYHYHTTNSGRAVGRSCPEPAGQQCYKHDWPGWCVHGPGWHSGQIRDKIGSLTSVSVKTGCYEKSSFHPLAGCCLLPW